MKYNNEQILVKELKRYNEEAFNYFVLKYQRMIMAYVHRIIHNEDEAWNISQEVFIAIFKNIGSFREDSSIKTWLFKITRNYTINRLRYLKSRKVDKMNSIEASKEKYVHYDLSITENPFTNFTKKEALVVLEQALDQLKESDKEIIILRDLNELNYEEISNILDINLGTVKSRIYRAREKLKQSYQNIIGEAK